MSSAQFLTNKFIIIIVRSIYIQSYMFNCIYLADILFDLIKMPALIRNTRSWQRQQYNKLTCTWFKRLIKMLRETAVFALRFGNGSCAQNYCDIIFSKSIHRIRFVYNDCTRVGIWQFSFCLNWTTVAFIYA